jgi:hypothetical protein
MRQPDFIAGLVEWCGQLLHARNRPNGRGGSAGSFGAEAEPLQRDATPAKQRLILVGMRHHEHKAPTNQGAR